MAARTRLWPLPWLEGDVGDEDDRAPRPAAPQPTLRVAALAMLLLAGCAFCRVRPTGAVDAIAVGHAACERHADGSIEVHGGALSNNLSETLAAAIAAVGAYFGVAM